MKNCFSFVDIVQLEILFMLARIVYYCAHRLWLEEFGVKLRIVSITNHFFCELGRDRHYSIPGAEHLGMARGTSVFCGTTDMDIRTYVGVS